MGLDAGGVERAKHLGEREGAKLHRIVSYFAYLNRTGSLGINRRITINKI